ncbi:MAG: hypothetical protein HY291_16255 [Planctomycetes bacterium]|nr:hypothetical protein [Planctomycetota bacterium]
MGSNPAAPTNLKSYKNGPQSQERPGPAATRYAKPADLQEKLAAVLQHSNRKTSFISRRGDMLNKVVPDWAVTVDVWQKMRVAPHGFVELEVHVGKEGIGTPKFVAHSQFWVSVVN